MKSVCLPAIAVVSLVCLGWLGMPSAFAEEATGVVFNDLNGNGARDAGEPGLKEVPVSNGEAVVLTDADGKYRLPINGDTILFVIKPSGWMTPVSAEEKLPRFYYVHSPEGSPALRFGGFKATGALPASVDFPLTAQADKESFQVICFGDTQTRNREEVRFLGHDVIEPLIGSDAAFGITLGDVGYNDLSIFEPLARCVGKIGVPWHHAIGNHDCNYDAPTPETGDDSFERVFGPSYYAFNYGQVHFIVLNDARVDPNEGYHTGLGERQLAFLKNDLSFVPADRLIVLMMHIPIMSIAERDALFTLLAPYPHTFSLSAHTHDQEHVFIDKSGGWKQDTPHHHLIHNTACGSWWGGMLDEVGLPNTPMCDGGPNGYSLLTFKGADYSVEFFPARQLPNYQMNIALPETVPAAETGATSVLVNVFAGSERSKVEMSLDDDASWTPLTQCNAKDPAYAWTVTRLKALARRWVQSAQSHPSGAKPRGGHDVKFTDVVRRLPKASTTPHMWKASLPAGIAPGDHVVHVRTTDMFGHVYVNSRLFTVTK